MVVHAALVGGWVSFAVVLLLTLIFSFIYVRYYQSKYESELSSTITAILALSVALLTCALGPVDIFLVAFMKNSNGTFKEWAALNTTRTDVQHSVLDAYFALYGCVIFFLFLALPFMYFYYEEKDDDAEVTVRQRCCTAFKYSLGFIFIAGVLLLIGGLVPFQGSTINSNATDWKRIEELFQGFGKNGGEDALSFTMSILTLVGILAFIFYTGYGMAAWPIYLIKGKRSAKKERMEVMDRRTRTQARRQAIKEKYKDGKRMSARDRQKLEDLDETEHLFDRCDRHLEAEQKSWISKCLIICRPFEVVFGIVFILVDLLIFLSLLLANIDKAIHSLGPKMGYALPHATLPNPLDISLTFCQKVFPLDYILMCFVIMYFFFCSMAGVKQIGIWFFWIRMYKIRPRRTRPQALLMTSMILMFIVLGINIIVYQLTPQYSTFGSQQFWNTTTSVVGNTTQTETKLTKCSLSASKDECVMTGLSYLLTRFFYKLWFFGAAYYWASWVFLAVMALGFLVAICRRRRSSIDGEVEEDDFDSDDEAMIRA